MFVVTFTESLFSLLIHGSSEIRLYLCRKAILLHSLNQIETQTDKRWKNEVIFTLPFCGCGRCCCCLILHSHAFSLRAGRWRMKCSINFGITRYGPLITIIMWCHCESASESNGHVYAITFRLFLLLVLLLLLLSVSSFGLGETATATAFMWYVPESLTLRLYV